MLIMPKLKEKHTIDFFAIEIISRYFDEDMEEKLKHKFQTVGAQSVEIFTLLAYNLFEENYKEDVEKYEKAVNKLGFEREILIDALRYQLEDTYNKWKRGV